MRDWDGGVVISPANVCSMLHSAAFFCRETRKKRAEKGMGKNWLLIFVYVSERERLICLGKSVDYIVCYSLGINEKHRFWDARADTLI